MSINIQRNILKTVIAEANTKAARRKTEGYQILLSYAIAKLSFAFFWLPVHQILLELQLIDPRLEMPDTMVDEGFASNSSKRLGVKNNRGTDTFYLTRKGYEMFELLLNRIKWDNIHLAPEGFLEDEIKDARAAGRSKLY